LAVVDFIAVHFVLLVFPRTFLLPHLFWGMPPAYQLVEPLVTNYVVIVAVQEHGCCCNLDILAANPTTKYLHFITLSFPITNSLETIKYSL